MQEAAGRRLFQGPKHSQDEDDCSGYGHQRDAFVEDYGADDHRDEALQIDEIGGMDDAHFPHHPVPKQVAGIRRDDGQEQQVGGDDGLGQHRSRHAERFYKPKVGQNADDAVCEYLSRDEIHAVTPHDSPHKERIERPRKGGREGEKVS